MDTAQSLFSNLFSLFTSLLLSFWLERFTFPILFFTFWVQAGAFVSGLFPGPLSPGQACPAPHPALPCANGACRNPLLCQGRGRFLATNEESLDRRAAVSAIGRLPMSPGCLAAGRLQCALGGSQRFASRRFLAQWQNVVRRRYEFSF